MRKVLPLPFLLLISHFCLAQDYISPKKGSLIGFSVNGTDFPSMGKLSKTSFSNLDYGFSVMYWKGLSKRIDFSVRYNGIFTAYSKNNNNTASGYANEFEGAFHIHALTDKHLLNPFLTAGAGIGNYNGQWGTYAPLGAGLQFNFSSITYLFLQGNYRASLNSNNLDDHLFYSLGITANISQPKAPPPPKQIPVPVVENKDRDGDGIPDSLDACPDVAGPAQFNGCPDTDGDGIPDNLDKCPTQKGTPKYNGCPVPDTDGDGINDDEDKCPTVAGVAKYNGCPIPDSDGDGVNDEEDRCPNTAGTKENQGCPVVKAEVARQVAMDAKNIFFATGRSRLLPKSFKSLDEVVTILQNDKDLKLDIEGHTDNTGSPQKNQVLSENRAKSVLAYLTSKGIDAARLTANGYGDKVPIGNNRTASGRALNRRVELKPKY